MGKTIGERVRGTREQRVWTQEQLAQAAGMSLIAVKRVEGDKHARGPRPTTVQRLAAALGVEPRWLVSGVGRKAAQPAGTERGEDA